MAREQGPKGLKTRGEILEGELATLHASSKTRMGELSLV